MKWAEAQQRGLLFAVTFVIPMSHAKDAISCSGWVNHRQREVQMAGKHRIPKFRHEAEVKGRHYAIKIL